MPTERASNFKIKIEVGILNDIIQNSDFSFYFKVFSGVLSQDKKLSKIIQTISNDVNYSSKKWKIFRIF
jgi:hypothetical protein